MPPRRLANARSDADAVPVRIADTSPRRAPIVPHFHDLRRPCASPAGPFLSRGTLVAVRGSADRMPSPPDHAPPLSHRRRLPPPIAPAPCGASASAAGQSTRATSIAPLILSVPVYSSSRDLLHRDRALRPRRCPPLRPPVHHIFAPSPRCPSVITVANDSPGPSGASDIARRWCRAKGPDWTLLRQLGVGGTAPVFEVESPDGLRALKIYNAEFSSGTPGDIERDRIQQQLNLRNHDCRSLVQVYDGGITEDRLYLLMSRAPGTELEKRLPDVPRTKIRSILHDVARASLFLRDRNLCHRDIKAANIFVSDDFAHATLLDISVVRNIHDRRRRCSRYHSPTVRDGQLPVLATSRYGSARVCCSA